MLCYIVHILMLILWILRMTRTIENIDENENASYICCNSLYSRSKPNAH